MPDEVANDGEPGSGRMTLQAAGYFVAALAGWVLLVSGAGKLREPADAKVLVRQVLPSLPAGVIIGAVSVAELTLGMALLLSIETTYASLGGVLLCASFVGFLLMALRRGAQGLDCGCSGSLAPTNVGAWSLIRAACLGLILAIGLVQGSRELSSTDRVVVATAAGVILLLLLAVQSVATATRGSANA